MQEMSPFQWLLFFGFNYTTGLALAVMAYMNVRVLYKSGRYGPEAILYAMFLAAMSAQQFLAPVCRWMHWPWVLLTGALVVTASTALAAFWQVRMRWRG